MNPRIYLSPPHMSGEELELVKEAFATNWIAPLGPHVDAFERELAAYSGVPHAAALSSGTAAIHLALRLLGLRPGDEVLCSTFTFSASANPIAYEGARPVFVDSESASWNMDPGLLREELDACAARGQLPRAVIVVDLYGQCADYDPILDACAQYGVPVIQDSAEALGATYKGGMAGGQGRLGVFSFNGNKIITTSGGGMLVSDDARLIERARFLATQARDPAPHYQHSVIGFNYRMSNVLAGIGRGQLRALPDRIAARRRNFEHYRAALGSVPGIGFMPLAPYGERKFLAHVHHDRSREKFGATREDVRHRPRGGEHRVASGLEAASSYSRFSRTCRVRETGKLPHPSSIAAFVCRADRALQIPKNWKAICALVRAALRVSKRPQTSS